MEKSEWTSWPSIGQPKRWWLLLSPSSPSYKNTGQYHIMDICFTLLCTHTCFIPIRSEIAPSYHLYVKCLFPFIHPLRQPSWLREFLLAPQPVLIWILILVWGQCAPCTCDSDGEHNWKILILLRFSDLPSSSRHSNLVRDTVPESSTGRSLGGPTKFGGSYPWSDLSTHGPLYLKREGGQEIKYFPIKQNNHSSSHLSATLELMTTWDDFGGNALNLVPKREENTTCWLKRPS